MHMFVLIHAQFTTIKMTDDCDFRAKTLPPLQLFVNWHVFTINKSLK